MRTAPKQANTLVSGLCDVVVNAGGTACETLLGSEGAALSGAERGSVDSDRNLENCTVDVASVFTIVCKHSRRTVDAWASGADEGRGRPR